MDEPEGRSGIRITELIVIAVLVFLVAFFMLPGLRQSRESAKSRDTVVTTLHRIDVAKNQYATDYHKPVGSRVSMEDLVKTGYMSSIPKPPTGNYVVGPVGTPAEFDEDAK